MTHDPADPCGATGSDHLFLLQMAGRSGSGKSTLAARLAAASGAVVLDMDIVKSTALDVGVEWDRAGELAYRSIWSVAESLLQQEFHVILDSPCRFEWIIEETTAIAERRAATYCFIECVVPDDAELGRRLRSRPRLRSQLVDVGISSPDVPADRTVAAQARAVGRSPFASRYPPTSWLRLDTRDPAERCLDLALAYVRERQGVALST
jgi:predicted kinase